jgi:hypothetical protein
MVASRAVHAATIVPYEELTMRGKLALGLALAMALASFAAMAEQAYVDIEQRLTPEQRHATGLDTLSPTQLQLLNSLLRVENVKVAKAAKEEASHAEEGKSHAWSIGLDSDPIKTRLKGSISEWEPGTVFELENGQTWKVLKGHVKLRKTLVAPKVLLKPGIAGRWFLEVEEDMPAPRVYRID